MSMNVSMNDFIWHELKFFIARLSSLRVSESLILNDDAFCVYTGTYYENMIYYPDCKSDSEGVSKMINFFGERDASFMWFARDSKSLEDSGLIYAGDFTAMSLESNHTAKYESNPDIEILRINSRHESELWARTAWLSFGSEGEVTDNYYAFVDALNNDRENLSMYLAFHKGKASGTFLTTVMGGVYYFGVLPEMRRMGIAREMMNEICRQNKQIVLQSTPSGYAFYKSFGFNERFRIPLYSNEEDIF